MLTSHDEEVLEEEELSTTIVEKRELLRAEDHLERVLQVRKTLIRHHKLNRKDSLNAVTYFLIGLLGCVRNDDWRFEL